VAHVARRKVQGVLLAGGQSSRMGADKALIDFDGAPMIAWCAAALAECAPSLVVSSSSAPHAARCARALQGAWPRFTVLRGVLVETVVDAPGTKGPLAGLAAALSSCSAPLVVVSACDTPLVPALFYRRAVGLLGQFEAAAPGLDAPEPLISAWERAPALALTAALLQAGRGPRALLERLRSRLIPPEELRAWGVDPARLGSANTPEALQSLLDLARGLG
jgi:molybdenum cofactor guanylyltransferase